MTVITSYDVVNLYLVPELLKFGSILWFHNKKNRYKIGYHLQDIPISLLGASIHPQKLKGIHCSTLLSNELQSMIHTHIQRHFP